MPFKSKKQRAYLYAKEPHIAEKWAAEHGNKIVKKKGGKVKLKKGGTNADSRR